MVAKIEQMFYNVVTGKVIAMDEREDEVLEMTNEEYREELNRIFLNINENYKLRWFYRFITEKLRSSH